MYAIFNLQTGQQHKPKSRGATNFQYPSKHAADQAISAMPAKWRGRYGAMTLEQGRELAATVNAQNLADDQGYESNFRDE